MTPRPPIARNTHTWPRKNPRTSPKMPSRATCEVCGLLWFSIWNPAPRPDAHKLHHKWCGPTTDFKTVDKCPPCPRNSDAKDAVQREDDAWRERWNKDVFGSRDGADGVGAAVGDEK